MKDEWIYRTTGLLGTDHEMGPFSEAEMVELAEKGTVNLNTLVSSGTATRGNWCLLSQVPAFEAPYREGLRYRTEQEEKDRKHREHQARLAEEAREEKRQFEAMIPPIPPAPVTTAPETTTRHWLQVSAKILTWPRQCACCGGTADSEMRVSASKSKGKRVVTTTTSWWTVPHCSRCVGHINKYATGKSLLVWGIVLAIIVAVLGLFVSQIMWLGALLGVGIFIGFIVLAQKVKAEAVAMTTTSCACADKAVEYVTWHGTVHEFIFSNEEYVKAFTVANRSKTMSDIRRVN